MAENKENSSEDQVEAAAEVTESAATDASKDAPESEAAEAEATPESEATPVSDTAPEEPEAEATPEVEAAPEATPEAAPEEPEAEATPEVEAAPEAETTPEAAPEAPEPEAVPAPPAKRTRPRRHLPRSKRRTRPAKVRDTTPAKKGARKPLVRLPKPEAERGNRQERRGVVVSSAMDKTIVVKVDTLKAHTKYRKVVRRSKKYHAHDEENSAKVGDVVRIVETRPLSATKSWRIVEIVEVAK